jgi:hypothetical protein
MLDQNDLDLPLPRLQRSEDRLTTFDMFHNRSLVNSPDGSSGER